MRRESFGIALVAWIIAGCGNDTQQGATESQTESTGQAATEQRMSDKIPNPCSLLTSADVEQTLGMPVEEVEGPKPPDPDPGGLLCHWQGELGGYFSVVIYSMADGCSPEQQGPGVPVDGLGGTAAWREEYGDQHLCIDNDGMPVKLSAISIDPPAGQASLVALANIVLSRI